MLFQKRSYEAELMDDLNLEGEALHQNLVELEVINDWLGGNAVVLQALNSLRKRTYQPEKSTWRIADLGTGGGDVLRSIAHWARRKKQPIALTGIDANPFMLAYATEKALAYPEIKFEQANIFAPDFSLEGFDWVLFSLFCHHFTEEELVKLFRQVYQQASKGFIINDLHRHPLAYYSIWAITRLVRGSYLVQNDAPLSVARAFKRSEIERLLKQAGIPHYHIQWKWAFRWQVIVWK